MKPCWGTIVQQKPMVSRCPLDPSPSPNFFERSNITKSPKHWRMKSYILKSDSISAVTMFTVLCVKSTTLLNREKKQTILYIIVIDGLTSEGPAFKSGSPRAVVEFSIWFCTALNSELWPLRRGRGRCLLWYLLVCIRLPLLDAFSYMKILCKTKLHSYWFLVLSLFSPWCNSVLTNSSKKILKHTGGGSRKFALLMDQT